MYRTELMSANPFRIEVHNVGTVCSLRTSEEGAKVRIANFLGQNEEWTLEDVSRQDLCRLSM